MEPIWLTRVALDVIHHDVLMEHGGLPGTRDENALEAAIARPKNRWFYEDVRTVHGLATSYGYGLARSRPYIDGNKRIGFLAMASFLEINGMALTATNEEVVQVMRDVAAGAISEPGLSDWIRART